MSAPAVQSVPELVAARAAELGDRTYLVFQDQSYSFAQVHRQVEALAAGLAELGLGRGDRVALLVRNSPEFVFIWWAVLRLGAVMVPVNLRLTAREAAYILGHSQAKALVMGEQSLELLPELRRACPGVSFWLGVGLEDHGQLLPLEALCTRGGSPPEVSLGLEDQAVILYTSGTTGFPKGVVHTHGSYLMTAASFARTCGLKASDRLLTANPLFHVNAQFYSCLGTLWAGATFILAERFSASRMWDWTRRYQANKVVMLLAITTILYNRPPRPDDADNPVELVVAGGAPKGHYHDFERRFGVKLQTLYSLTEAPLAVMSPLEEPCVDGAVGLPMRPGWPGLENHVRVVDDQGRDLPPGQTGQIVIKNPAVMRGYYRDPQATAQVLKGGWLHTGDLGRMDRRGWLYFLGRAKDVIRKKGENISAAEVEGVLNDAAEVVEAAVKGVSPPDAAGEEEIMAFVVRAPGAGPGWEDLIAHCEERLADFKVPRFWLAVEELPKNAMNRVVKAELGRGERPWQAPGTYDRLKGVTAS